MRASQYVRAPIQANALANLAITEAPAAGEITDVVPCPFSIEIAFDIPSGGPPPIAPIWEGDLWFVADTTVDFPKAVADVLQTNYPTWHPTGALVLLARDSVVTTQLRSDIPLLGAAPNLVRYEQVTLTCPFLFTTVKELLRRNTPGGIPVIFDPELMMPVPVEGWFERVLISFLHGNGPIPFVLDAAGPARDGMELPMPTVAATGARAALRLSFAVRSARAVSDPLWWSNTSYDTAGLPGPVDIVPSSLQTDQHRLFNPRHPAHSSVPAQLMLSLLPDGAWVPADAANPVRTWARSPRSDGSTWRRVDVARPPLPGAPVTEALRRLYPLYQFSTQPAAGAVVASQLSEDGRQYRPLTNQSYACWTTPRTGPSALASSRPALQVGRNQLVNHYLDLGSASVNLDFSSGPLDGVWAHAHPFDAGRIGEAWRALGNGFRPLRLAAMQKWGIPDEPTTSSHQNPRSIEWFIDRSAPTAWDDVYGWIAASAGRHFLAPEFLQAVLLGEGVSLVIQQQLSSGTPFDPTLQIHSFNFAGLDLIVYRTGRNASLPPHQPGQPVRPEFLFNLVAQNYLDASFVAALAVQPTLRLQEIGGLSVEWAEISGWEAAIELVAAELQARQDEMESFCALNGIPFDTEEKRRYLTYIRYVSQPDTAQAHAGRLASELAPWTGASDETLSPPGRRYRTLLRLAVAEWIEQSGVYR